MSSCSVIPVQACCPVSPRTTGAASLLEPVNTTQGQSTGSAHLVHADGPDVLRGEAASCPVSLAPEELLALSSQQCLPCSTMPTTIRQATPSSSTSMHTGALRLLTLPGPHNWHILTTPAQTGRDAAQECTIKAIRLTIFVHELLVKQSHVFLRLQRCNVWRTLLISRHLQQGWKWCEPQALRHAWHCWPLVSPQAVMSSPPGRHEFLQQSVAQICSLGCIKAGLATLMWPPADVCLSTTCQLKPYACGSAGLPWKACVC